MDDDGLVEKVRIGRENVITVAERDETVTRDEDTETMDGGDDEGEADRTSEGNESGSEGTGETSA
jgi:hypothetical protein